MRLAWPAVVFPAFEECARISAPDPMPLTSVESNSRLPEEGRRSRFAPHFTVRQSPVFLFVFFTRRIAPFTNINKVFVLTFA
jgi:hypothetical protein